MCGSYGGDFFRDGYCSTHQTCTGGTKDDWGKNWVTKNKKGDLCKSSNQLMIVILNNDFLQFSYIDKFFKYFYFIQLSQCAEDGNKQADVTQMDLGNPITIKVVELQFRAAGQDIVIVTKAE